MNVVQNVAHRGFSAKAPENTLAAFEWAIKAKADGIELDVHLTLDGEVVVIHDETLERTTNGKGWIKDLTLTELKQVSSGKWFADEFQAERIPVLSEVLELISGSDLWLNIELKNHIVMYPGLEEAVIREVERFGMENRVVLSSFNHYSLVHIQRYRPKLSLGALYDGHLYQPWLYAKALGVSAIHPFYTAATEEVVTHCHQHGILVRPYTVDQIEEMKRLMEIKVDAIITNVPDQLNQLLDRAVMDVG
ncbi:glycerophosphodiester phosphodiesterase [Thermoflavimicrobium dichotomicum]|uniref:Glycerophosphoryl diester phosphodiesterase n=1 Tax=Thermoflavimicrobium dichotomicum TaxID=46223 RepID=A0A1I3N8T6_9BACL|nr:glycerophosphodiester phosphodiesterase [Thermoflavimicrobium dichotomicum]SFJ05644.1 glycerophosphoryl diester phosphodiesterase [Thermoflavimicrobium dichotomicum]